MRRVSEGGEEEEKKLDLQGSAERSRMGSASNRKNEK